MTMDERERRCVEIWHEKSALRKRIKALEQEEAERRQQGACTVLQRKRVESEDRMRRVLAARNLNEPVSWEALAAEFNVSKGRIRQIEKAGARRALEGYQDG